MKNNILLLL